MRAVRCQTPGKRLRLRLGHLRHLGDDRRQRLDRAGDLVEANINEDPQNHVLTERKQV